MYVMVTCIFSEDERDLEKCHDEYAVVLFTKSNLVGVTYSGWLSQNEKQTLYPKNEDYAVCWMRNKRMPATVNEGKTKWKKLSCKVIIYAGKITLLYVIQHL